ncbi:MFS transporter [Streptosporangium lutulentum]
MVAIPQDLPGSPEYISKLRYAWRVCSVTSLGLVMIGISGSTLNVALPTVVRHFHADAFAAGWVLLAFLLVNTATLVFFGRVADLLGRRDLPGRLRPVHPGVAAGRAVPRHLVPDRDAGGSGRRSGDDPGERDSDHH